MGAGSGGSSQTTTVKSPKPFITQDYYSPEFLQNLAGVAKQYQDRAMMMTQRRQNLFNSLYTKPEYGNQPIYSPIVGPEGQAIDPNREVRIDAASVIPQDPSFYKPPKIKSGGGGKKKNQPQRERDKYLSAVEKTERPRMEGNRRMMRGGGF